MKYKHYIIVLISIIQIYWVNPALARPITEYTPENAQEIQEQFVRYWKTFPELFVDESIPPESTLYPTYIYLKQNNLLESWMINQKDETLSYLEFAKIALIFLENKPIRSRIAIPQSLNSHPDKEILQEAFDKRILAQKPRNAKFNADAPIPLTEINATLKKFLIPSFDKTPSISNVLEHFVSYTQKIEFADYSKHIPEISITKDSILIDNEPFEGVCANWSLQEQTTLTYPEILQEIQTMKKLGIRCISTEIGWKYFMPQEHNIEVSAHITRFFEIAEKEGMLVNLLLAPHYTPDWVFEKYDQDILMVDQFGVSQNEGEYITYSLSSPAVNDQIVFQKEAIVYFSKYNNILSFLLSNEISYGINNDLDYSNWATQEWELWLKERNLNFITPPKNSSHLYWKEWKRFRQIVLNNYFNKVYTEIKPFVPRNIPISHKFIPYEATSYFAANYGIHPSPKEIEGNILTTDIYGTSPNVYAFHHSFDMPKMVIETNLPGNWDKESMYFYLFMNYLHGIKIQSIFQWNAGTHENVMFYPDGSWWDKTYGITKAIRTLSQIHNLDTPESNSAIILPTHGINMYGKDFENFQYFFDDMSEKLLEITGKYPMILWIDDLVENGYFEIHPNIYTTEELSHLQYVVYKPSSMDVTQPPLLEKSFEKMDTYLWKRVGLSQ